MEEIRQALTELLKEKFAKDATGHDWWHIERVKNLALHIGKAEHANLEVIELAALLHDIDDHKFNGGDYEAGGIACADILNKFNVRKTTAQQVTKIVANNSYSKGVTPNTIEGKVIQDADRIDAIGAIGIARCFAYGGFTGNPIFNPTLPIDKKTCKKSTSSIHHFYEKLLLLKDSLHTNTAKEIAQSRHQQLQNFLDQFFDEWQQLKFI